MKIKDDVKSGLFENERISNVTAMLHKYMDYPVILS